MTGKRNIGNMAAIGGLSAAIALLTGLPAASADELADLRANQELLQKRIDQLSQAPPAAPGQFVPGFGPETRPAAAPVSTGSFPRSFLIPGTDTSLRIGGIAWTDILWLMHGSRAAQVLNNTGGNPDGGQNGIGGTGTLASIPLNNSTAHSRAQSFTISSRPTRLLFDARTPTAWGEIKAYIEMDFAHSNENVVESGQTAVTNGYAPRLRKAYGTMGGLLVGQETGIFHDPDADAELLDFGGGASSPGRARTPQVKYTYQGPYGAVFTAGFENPSPRMQSVNGQSDLDTQASSALTACSPTVNTVANLPATTACLANTSFFNPLQSGWPEFIGTARINQPWGHMQIGAMVRTDRLNDGQYLDQKFVGYGGTISGDVHPFSGTPGALGKDDLGFGFGAGAETAGQLANGAGVVTTFGRTLNVPGFGSVNPLTNAAWNTANSPTRRAYDRVVQSESPQSFDAWIWYQHWWTENLRSTIEASGIWNALNTNLLGACTSCNKLLTASRANLIWSPVAFVDMGIEYGWGHRVTTQNFKGDAYELIGSMRVRF
jgi:porin-like protein/outer membrane DcaP-like protein